MTQTEFKKELETVFAFHNEEALTTDESIQRIMDMVPLLSDSHQWIKKQFNYSTLATYFTLAERDDVGAEFFTPGGIALLFKGELDPFLIKKEFEKMGAEICYYRRPYELLSNLGYWLKPTQEFLKHIV